MLIQCSGNQVRIRAPAKVNLFLEVLGKRADGFHDIETLLCPISLFDELTLEPTDSGEISFALEFSHPSATGSDNSENEHKDVAWKIPANENNLVVQAVKKVQSALNTTFGCRIRLNKQIPAAAGLGGGSSDAAAAVVASLVAWERWDRQCATEICTEVGSDVPFFLGEVTGIGLTLAKGRGELCQLLKAQPQLNFIVTHPPVGCATKEVYLNYAKGLDCRHAEEIVSACENGQFQKIGAELFNALQLSASTLTDWIDQQLLLLKDAGAEFVLMSGSGSSCFALINDRSCQERILSAATILGLTRVFAVEAWYADSIELQLKKQLG